MDRLTKRPISEGAENLLGLYFPVLDKGFVAMCDYMGTDQCIETAARVSYGAGTRKTSQTKGLLRYLRRHKHTSPYEMIEFKFHCSMPIFVARQWIRSRTANVNEISGRYSLLPMLFYTPEENQFQKQSALNNQGRSEQKLSTEKYKETIDRWNTLRRQNQRLYEDLTDAEVARELARIDLPLSTYTQWYWKIDLHNLFHFLTLRTDSHAQYEIRAYADVIAGMMKLAVPISYEAWIDYAVGASQFSRQEMEILRELVKVKELDGRQYLQGENDVSKTEIERHISSREVSELFEKLTAKPLPEFSLDLSAAKTPEYFEKLMAEAVPKTYKSSVASPP